MPPTNPRCVLPCTRVHVRVSMRPAWGGMCVSGLCAAPSWCVKQCPRCRTQAPPRPPSSRRKAPKWQKMVQQQKRDDASSTEEEPEPEPEPLPMPDPVQASGTRLAARTPNLLCAHTHKGVHGRAEEGLLRGRPSVRCDLKSMRVPCVLRAADASPCPRAAPAARPLATGALPQGALPL